MSVDTSKIIKSPEVTYDYDKKSESLCVTVELPGVEAGGFKLRIATCGFRVDAETGDVQYKGCYMFFHEVDAEAAEYKLKNGTLTIRVPFFAPICGKQYPIDMDMDSDSVYP